MLDTIIFIILLALGLWLAWKIIKSVIKVIAIGVLIIVLVSGIMGLLVYRDFQELRDFESEPKLLLLKSGETLLTGVVVSNMTDDYQPASTQEMVEYNKAYENKEYRKIYRNLSRAIVFSEAFFNEGLPETVELEEYLPQTFDKDEMMVLLTSEEVDDYQAYVFLSAVGHTLDARGNVFLYSQFNDENIEIYPNSILVAAAKRLPSWLVIPVVFILSL